MLHFLVLPGLILCGHTELKHLKLLKTHRNLFQCGTAFRYVLPWRSYPICIITSLKGNIESPLWFFRAAPEGSSSPPSGPPLPPTRTPHLAHRAARLTAQRLRQCAPPVEAWRSWPERALAYWLQLQPSPRWM